MLFATSSALGARGADEPSEQKASPDSLGTTTATSRAAVVLVGDLDEGGEIVALLRELLGRQGVECEFSGAARFDPDALFAEERAGVAVRVFIRLADENRARLYFRGPAGARFLLRTVTLPSGLDEVGRELIGQVVESSVVTLLRSSNGLSRKQASDEVARETRVLVPPPPPRRTPEHTRPKAAGHRPFVLSATLRYALESFGPDLGLAHGPGLELGVGTRGAFRLRARLSGEWFFEQTLDATELEARVRTSPLRAGIDAGFELAETHIVTLGFAGGVDIVRVKPGAPLVDGVTPSEPTTSQSPVLRPELRYEFGAGSLVLGVLAFVDVSLVHTHYDLSESAGLSRLGTPWVARPGGALLLGVRW